MTRAALKLLGATAALSACAGSGTGTSVNAQAPYPTSPPPAMELRDLEFPEYGEAMLSNGMRLIVVENHELPIVSVRVSMPAGSAYDPEGLEGLSEMTATLLTQGTEMRSAEEIAQEIEEVGGFLNAFSGTDFLSVSTTVLTDHVDIAFDLLGEVIGQPTFPEDELERERARTLSALRLQKSSPGALASEFFLRSIYGGHPYGRQPSEASVNAINREDVVAFADSRLRPGGAIMVVAGDMSLREARDYAERYLEEWEGSAPEVEFPETPAPEPTSILLVHRPGSDQSNVRVGNLALRPGSETYYPAVVGNRVLGGGSDARLFLILREDKAWTYGAYSGITRNSDIGYFQANTEVRNAVTDSALTELLDQLERIRNEPVPQDELDGAKGYLVGSFPRRIETPQQIAGQVSTVYQLGLPANYLETYRSRLQSVGPQAIMTAMQQVVKPDSAVIVVVGDGSVIYEDLAAIAPVRVIDIDGNPLDPAALNAIPLEYDTGRLEPQSWTYRVMAQGQELGAQAAELTRQDDGTLVYTEDTSFPQFGARIQLEVRFTLADGAISMISSQENGRLGPVTINTDVTFDGAHITGTGQSPSQGGQVETVQIDTTITSRVIDENLLQLLLTITDLEVGTTYATTMFDPSEGTVTRATATVTGTEQVTVPAGTFDAYRVEINGVEDSALVMTVSTEEAPRILTIEIVGQPLKLELAE